MRCCGGGTLVQLEGSSDRLRYDLSTNAQGSGCRTSWEYFWGKRCSRGKEYHRDAQARQDTFVSDLAAGISPRRAAVLPET